MTEPTNPLPPHALIEPLPTGLQVFDSVEHMAGRLAALIGGRGFTLKPGVGAYSGYATTAMVHVTAAGDWLACAVLNSKGGVEQDLQRLDAALGLAIAAQRRAA